jgi:hypothetical protein
VAYKWLKVNDEINLNKTSHFYSFMLSGLIEMKKKSLSDDQDFSERDLIYTDFLTGFVICPCLIVLRN